MTDSKSPTARKRGNRVVIEFLSPSGAKHSVPPVDLSIVRAVAVETNTEFLVDMDALSPTITRQLAGLGLSLLARNSGNTAEDAEDARATMEARIGAIIDGNYYASSRTVSGTPLLFRAMLVLMTRLRDAMPIDHPKRYADDQLVAIVNTRLTEWRGEGLFDNLDPEAAEKALKKHRNDLRKRYEGITGLVDVMAEIRAESAKPIPQVDAMDLF